MTQTTQLTPTERKVKEGDLLVVLDRCLLGLEFARNHDMPDSVRRYKERIREYNKKLKQFAEGDADLMSIVNGYEQILRI